MPDDQTETATETPQVSTTPETPPEHSADNEQIPATANSPKAGNVEKIRAAASRVISQAGFLFKKGRGRPKNCRACEGNGCDVCNFTGKEPGKLDSQIPATGGNISSVPPIIPASGIPEGSPMASFATPAPADNYRGEMFRRACKAAVKGVLEILKAVVGTYANAAGVDSKFTKTALEKASPDDEALRDFSDSLDAVLKKHTVEPKHAEEIALAVNGARLIAPFALLLAEFKGEIARQRAERKGAA